MPAINNAQSCAFAACGAGKADMMARLLAKEKEGLPDEVECGQVREHMLDEKDEHVVDPAQKERVRAKDEIDHAQPEGHLVD